MVLVNKKAQQGGAALIIGLMMVFVTVIVFSALIPLLSEIITNTSAEVGGTAGLVLGLIPLAITVSLLAAVFVLVRPQFAREG